MSRLTRDGTAEPVSGDPILRRERGRGNIRFPCSADHEQEWQPYPTDPYFAICEDYTYVSFQIVAPYNGGYSTSYILIFGMAFFCLVTTGWVSDINLCETSIKKIEVYIYTIKLNMALSYCLLTSSRGPYALIYSFIADLPPRF